MTERSGQMMAGLSAALSCNVAARTATVTGTGIDTFGFNGALLVVVAGTWTDGTHTFTADESNVVGSGYTAVAAADLDGTLPLIDAAGDNNVVTIVAYKGTKRFVRLVSTVAGATTGAIYGALVLRGSKKYI